MKLQMLTICLNILQQRMLSQLSLAEKWLRFIESWTGAEYHCSSSRWFLSIIVTGLFTSTTADMDPSSQTNKVLNAVAISGAGQKSFLHHFVSYLLICHTDLTFASFLIVVLNIISWMLMITAIALGKFYHHDILVSYNPYWYCDLFQLWSPAQGLNIWISVQ